MKANRPERRKRGAFTLIEVLLVLVILVILGALSVGAYTQIQKSALAKAAKAQIANLKTFINIYQQDMGDYPTSLEQLAAPPEQGTRYKGPYIEVIPVDPWGRPYQYQYPGQHRDYDLWSEGPDGRTPIGNWD